MTSSSSGSKIPGSKTSLPERWKRGRQRAALSCLAALVLFTGALHDKGSADVLDSWWLRARFSLREWWSEKRFGPERDERIAIVAVDDKSFDKWPEPFLAWNDHLADATRYLLRSGARLVAFDWTQGMAFTSVGGHDFDAKFGQVLSQTRHVVFVKFIRNGTYLRPAPSLLYALPDAYLDGGKNYLGFAEFTAPNDIQTALFPEIAAPGGPEISFAQRVITNSGLKPPQPMPLREDGSFLINYLGGTGSASPFEEVSLCNVAASGAKNAPPDARWKGKIVFIGSTYKGSNDLLSVPFSNGLIGSRLVPGVLVQANAARTLLDANPISEPEMTMLWFLAAVMGALGVGAYAMWNWGRATFVTVALVLGWTALSLLLFVVGDYALPVVVPLSSLVFGAALMGGYRALNEERERAQVMKIWGRHQDPRLIEELLAHPEWRGGEGREVAVTVLFADLKNFTKTVESLSPAAALEALNRYLSLIARTVVEQGGVVDKYLGDGLMAQWGAPTARPDHADAAVRACLAIEQKLAVLTPRLRAAGDVAFETRLTLHSGPVVAGPVGSDDSKLEYTLIGDTVNVTSRLQETAKEMGCDFLISETTFELLETSIRTGRESQVAIRGRQQPLRVFEVLDDQIGSKTAPKP